MLEVMTYSYNETFELGRKLGSLLLGREFIILCGNLAAGKTCFASGVAAGAGSASETSSPTYAIVNEYEGRVRICHFDLYRLESLREIEKIGFDDYLHDDSVKLIEWPGRAKTLLPKDMLKVIILPMDQNKRSVRFVAQGAHYRKLLEELKLLVDTCH